VVATTSKIIIIDDEKRMCDSLSALLEGEGHDVSGYQNPAQAIEAIRGHRVDLVISDIKMPEMDGLEILRVVKQIDEGIPVILLTGYASLDSALEAISQGAYDYLLKPVDFNRLDVSVNRAIERRQAEISRLRLVEELRLSNLILQQRVGELNALYEAGKSIGSSVNLQELLRQIVVLASSVTEANVGSIMLVDETDEFLTIEAAIGLHEDIVAKTRLPLGASIAGYVAKTGEPVIVADVEKDDRFKRINRERYGAASLLCAPLRIKNVVLGVINMANKDGGQSFTEDDLRLLTNFASQAAVAVDDASQFQRNQRRLVEFEILHDIANQLPGIDSFDRFRQALVEELGRVFKIDYAIWFDWDPSNKILVPTGALGQTDLPLTESGKVDVSRVSRDAMVVTGLKLDEVNLDDYSELSLFMGERLGNNKHFPQPNEAYMAIPVIRNSELVHVFYLGSDAERPYSVEDVSLARLVVSQASVLFEKEKAMLNATRLMTMGNMISEISHDLRKPLTSIKGGLQILRQRWPEQTDSSDFFNMAEDEIHRMNDLVRELVDFSNPNRYETSKLDLRQCVARAAELVRPDLRKRKIEFSSTFADVNWEIIANKNQVMEIFLNLFINASDAMPDGGSLTVTGVAERPGHKKDDYLAIQVADTGCGIKKGNLSRIFDRYYTTKESGTGLGLAVVERVISAHSGTLHIDSTQGEGTTFTVYFPYKP
jgi:signal transduction histidine kinase/FixJ family two-component response regulator/putative methionine-R-sulfoxide reductase with GAF domain